MFQFMLSFYDRKIRHFSTFLFLFFLASIFIQIIPVSATEEENSAVMINSGEDLYKEESSKKDKPLGSEKFAIKSAVEEFYTIYTDSDNIEIKEIREKIRTAINKKNILEFAWSRSSYIEEEVKSVNANNLILDYIYKEKKKAYKAEYIYRNFSKINDDRHGYGFEYSGPIGFLNQVRFKHGYDSIVSTKAIRNKVTYYAQSIAINQEVIRNWNTDGFYQYLIYSDSNRRHSGRAGLFYMLTRTPNVQVGYEYHTKDNKFSSPNYSTPNLLNLNLGKIKVDGSLLESSFYYAAAFGAGLAQENGIEDKSLIAVDLYLEHQLNRKWNYYFAYDFYKDTTYNGQTVQMALMYNF